MHPQPSLERLCIITGYIEIEIDTDIHIDIHIHIHTIIHPYISLLTHTHTHTHTGLHPQPSLERLWIITGYIYIQLSTHTYLYSHIHTHAGLHPQPSLERMWIKGNPVYEHEFSKVNARPKSQKTNPLHRHF